MLTAKKFVLGGIFFLFFFPFLGFAKVQTVGDGMMPSIALDSNNKPYILYSAADSTQYPYYAFFKKKKMEE
jgi:hypothetical protein